jgi:hypothetical protein
MVIRLCVTRLALDGQRFTANSDSMVTKPAHRPVDPGGEPVTYTQHRVALTVRAVADESELVAWVAAGTYRRHAVQLSGTADPPWRRTHPADAISSVSVLPTHRRRELLTQLMHADLQGRAATDSAHR